MKLDPSLFAENERTAPDATGRQLISVGPMELEFGGSLPDVTVAYQTWGDFRGDNAILVEHALSGDSNAAGWWSALVGPGKALDTDRFFVVGTNALGGCQGTTGPSSPAPDGRPYGSRFPLISVGDMVEVQARLADALGVPTWRMVAGGSMGGMQALEWSVKFPDRVQTCFLTATAARHSPMQIGFNEVGRQAIRRDPKWLGGDYPLNDPPRHGLSVARMIGHLTFLSPDAFEAKFGRRYQGKSEPSYHFGTEFEVESYLAYQGDKFTTRFDANSQLVLTRAIDYYDCRSLESARCRYGIVGYDSDWIYPLTQSRELRQMAEAAGRDVIYQEISLPYGHDAFLLDGEHQTEVIRQLLD